MKTLLIGNPNAGEGFEGIGFSNFKANSFWQNAPTKDSIGVCAAKKNIKDINGEEILLSLLLLEAVVMVQSGQAILLLEKQANMTVLLQREIMC